MGLFGHPKHNRRRYQHPRSPGHRQTVSLPHESRFTGNELGHEIQDQHDLFHDTLLF
jgi:hypothetical protein